MPVFFFMFVSMVFLCFFLDLGGNMSLFCLSERVFVARCFGFDIF